VLAVEQPRLTSSRSVLDGHTDEPPPLSARRLKKEIPIILPPLILDVYEVSGQVRNGILANGNPISYLDPFGLGAVGDNESTSWLSTGWNAVAGTVTSGVQDVYNVLYTGQVNPSADVYDAAVDAAGDYVYDSGGVRGFYGGVGMNGKYPGAGSLAGQAGLTGTWTVDDGAGAEIDAGAGLQERGQNSLGMFTSQTVGVGSSYQFWSQGTGFQAPSLGSGGNISAPSIYGGTANSQGGANFIMQNQNNAGIGINYGTVYGGLIVNPSLVMQNFIDSYHIITGTH